MNAAADLAVPPAVVTAIGPVVAPFGTTATTLVPSTLKTEGLPLNVTRLAPVRALPVMVTVAPGFAEAGLNPEILGRTLKLARLHVVATAVVMATGPVSAPSGTMAVTSAAERTLNVAARHR